MRILQKYHNWSIKYILDQKTSIHRFDSVFESKVNNVVYRVLLSPFALYIQGPHVSVK
jgi:hypothetical protein